MKSPPILCHCFWIKYKAIWEEIMQKQKCCTFFCMQRLYASSLRVLCVCVCACTHVCMCKTTCCACSTAEFIDFHRDMTQAPLHLFTRSSICTPLHTHTLPHTHTHINPPATAPHPPSHSIPLTRSVLWGCRRVSSRKWISPHIPLSIKEPVCAPPAAHSTPLQLFVLADTSTCYLYLCCVSGYQHLMHSAVWLVLSCHIDYFGALLFMHVNG